MGRASRRRREKREQHADGASKLYRQIPAAAIGACEEMLRAYTAGRALAPGSGGLDTWQSMVFAEGAALEAVDLLTARRGGSGDLLFAALLDDPGYSALSPAMLPLLRFLRARLAGQDPVLRLSPDTPGLAVTLLLLAGQALVAAADREPGDPAVEALVEECLRRLATDPADARCPAGDLAFGLADEERDKASDDRFYRDEERKALTEAVPVRDAAARPGHPVLLVLDLTARPDVEDVLRLLHVDAPQGGADTQTWWRGLAGTDHTLVRLEITWFEPVHCQVAMVWDADEHRDLLLHIAASDHIDLAGTHPRDSPDSVITMTRVPAAGSALTSLLRDCAARRT